MASEEPSSPRKRIEEAKELDANLNAAEGTYPNWGDDCNSLLKKHLTQEVFDQLKDLKTSSNVSLFDCIRSGVENLDSGVGLYAGDEESYTLFAPLFNPLITDYHKLESDVSGNNQPADLDPNNLNCPDLDPNGKYILSTRIRVARNLRGYGLMPTLTAEQRTEVESKVTESLTAMEGDLQGTYYPLSGMDEATREQLVADHFLFKKGDRFLESAGINRDFPANRGIFHNANKTFLVWCNEEDQLRIISMQQGGDIGAVFERLCRAVNSMSSRMEFQFNENLGFLASCPTNLGTGMRASVHIKLPRACQDPRFQEICDQYQIQPRGIHGEHSETTGGVYDISNKRRLGLSEVQCVQSMYDGVKALIELEESLPWPKPVFPEDCNSLLKKHLTDEVWDQCNALVTSSGVTLMDCIRSGIENLDSGCGVYSGDQESYTLFAPLFNPLIEDYHKGFTMDMTQTRDLDPTHLECPDVDPENKYIISTRIRVARNIEGYGLTPTLTQQGRLEVEAKVTEALNGLEGELAGTYYPLSGMDEATRAQLVEDHFLFKRGDRFLEAAGVNRQWPEGRGIYHNNDKTFLVWLNEEDQLRVISMQPGGDIGAVFTRLCSALAAMENFGWNFQFDDHMGFLSSCPTNLGTGMRASVHIKLPLASQQENFAAICEEHQIQPRGIHGEHSETTGGVYDISNKRRLGLSEVECVQAMYNGVKALIELEKSLEAQA